MIEKLKHYFPVILAAIILLVIVAFVVHIINNTPIPVTDNKEKEYLKNQIYKDSMEIEALYLQIATEKTLAMQNKQKADYWRNKAKSNEQKTNEKQDSVAQLDSIAAFRFFGEWTSRPATHF